MTGMRYLNDSVIVELNKVDALCENDSRHYTHIQSLKILEELRDARRRKTSVNYLK